MEKDWMTEEYGVPHKNGHVRFYLISSEEDVYGYLGWFDMTDWDKGWDKVWEAAKKKRNVEDAQDFEILRHDQLLDLLSNVQFALQEALEDKEETTFLYWFNKRNPKEKSND